MEVIKKNLNKMLLYCEQVSLNAPDNGQLKSWIREMILKIGYIHFNNNLPRINELAINKTLILITSDKLVIETCKEINNTCFIEPPDNSENLNLFSTFIEVLFNKIKMNVITFYSLTNHLFEEEINLNLYNIENIHRFSEFLNLKDRFQHLKYNIINFDNSKIFQNNSLFINSSAKDLANNPSYKGMIFDIYLNNLTNPKLVIKEFQEIYNEIIKIERF